jgi:hypothetical protein
MRGLGQSDLKKNWKVLDVGENMCAFRETINKPVLKDELQNLTSERSSRFLLFLLYREQENGTL